MIRYGGCNERKTTKSQYSGNKSCLTGSSGFKIWTHQKTFLQMRVEADGKFHSWELSQSFLSVIPVRFLVRCCHIHFLPVEMFKISQSYPLSLSLKTRRLFFSKSKTVFICIYTYIHNKLTKCLLFTSKQITLSPLNVVIINNWKYIILQQNISKSI